MNAPARKKLGPRLPAWLRLDRLSPAMRRVVVGILGGVLLLAGLAMVVLPGPAIVFIPLGLALLATEFNWARRWFVRARLWFRRGRKSIRAA